MKTMTRSLSGWNRGPAAITANEQFT